ncbi:MAG: tRNA 2-thiouridine(34) synthase MnmA [Patescibacteria group bacterium]
MKILVAISGGVDSAVAAALLQKQKHQLIAVHLDLFGRTHEVEAARAVAAKLGIPFYVLNFRQDFERKVIRNFLANYAQNRTPNPCSICNREIKFGKLLQKMRELGCAKLATGHFAQIKNGKLVRGSDAEKDQSYFLSRVPAERFGKILLPLGGMTKAAVKKIAEKIGFAPLAAKKSSAGICFLRGIDLEKFLLENLPKKIFKKGLIRNSDGKIVGEHRGLPFFTIGQRRGVELGGMPRPHFVVGFDRRKNEIVVSEDAELFARKVRVKNLNWLGAPPKNGAQILAQIRYRHPAEPGKIFLGKMRTTFEFAEPVRAITPGQTIAFFRKNICLGGGEIC